MIRRSPLRGIAALGLGAFGAVLGLAAPALAQAVPPPPPGAAPSSGGFTPQALAADTDEADAAADAHEEAAGAYEDRQFLRAWRLDPTGYPALVGVDSPTFSVDTAYRSHTGDAEKSPASGLGVLLTGTTTRGLDVFGVQADYLSLHSAASGASAPSATLHGVEPGLFWRRESEWAPAAEIGATPFGGVLDLTLTGRLALTVPITNDLQAPIEISRTSVTDSVASYTGVRDPLSRRTFGRVVENAAKIKLDYTFAPRWSLAVTETAGLRTGERVRDTFHEELEAQVTYDFQVPGFSTFSVGPQVDYESFSRNQEIVRLGSGGYYSPRSLVRIGPGVEFVTREARRWVVSGTIEPALQREHEYGDSVTYQGAVSADVAASYQIARHVALGGLLHADSSREYGEFYVGVGLKLSLSPRAALLSTDLSRPSLR